MELFDLTGKVAIVTGGGGGIGLGMAEGLAAAGCALALVDLDEAKLAAARAVLESAGARTITVVADVTNEARVARMVEEVVSGLGRVDILFNNAGVGMPHPPETMEPSHWHKVIDSNLTSAFLCSRAVYPRLKQAGGGKIVNTASIMSFMALPFTAAYSSSKGGIVQLTKALATAWAADNIQVNAISPGWIETDMTRPGIQQREGAKERVEARAPVGRWGTPDDFRGVAVFLASRASDFVTGANIVVDGGFSSVG